MSIVYLSHSDLVVRASRTERLGFLVVPVLLLGLDLTPKLVAKVHRRTDRYIKSCKRARIALQYYDCAYSPQLNGASFAFFAVASFASFATLGRAADQVK